ncbi:cytidine deaminase [Marinicella sediminis]|uniref:Cytidine deaminase n=1 Tax=Marinicella sediminis TaxID=1792834 RepID=A0ABV7JB72_9GAMM|nr:cytidine deaminase [Marinicella sediminis]
MKPSITAQLYQAAKQAQDKAYAPYSHFRVGAAILDNNQQITAGCNVENAAYPIGCCAEQAAVAHMIMSGGQAIDHILIVGGDGQPCPPCGACRQIIFEHGHMETMVYLEQPDNQGNFTARPIKELLPDAFDHSQLAK